MYSAYFQTRLEWQLQFASFDHDIWEIQQMYLDTNKILIPVYIAWPF